MGRFVKPMSAAAASDGAEAIEETRSARDAQFSTKLSETLRRQRDESAGIKARTTLASEFFVRQFKIRGGSGFGKGTGGGRPGKNDKLLSNRVGELAKQYGVDESEFKNFSPFDWWCQNPAVDQMYREHNWDRTIEPQGQQKEEEVNREGGRGREREWERGEAMVVGFMTKEERGEGMRTCRNLRTTTTTSRRTTSRRGWRRRDYLHPQTMMRILLYSC